MDENVSLSFVDTRDCSFIWRYICKLFNLDINEQDEDVYKILKEDLETVVEYLTHPSYHSEKSGLVYNFIT